MHLKTNFSIWMPFISFSCLIAMTRMARTFCIMLNTSHGRWHLFSFQILDEIVSSHSIWCWCEYDTSILICEFVFFVIKKHSFKKCFSTHIQVTLWLVFFIVLMWHIMLIDLDVLSYQSILRINSILGPWTFHMYNWIWFANILLRIFISVFIKVCNTHLVIYPCMHVCVHVYPLLWF